MLATILFLTGAFERMEIKTNKILKNPNSITGTTEGRKENDMQKKLTLNGFILFTYIDK